MNIDPGVITLIQTTFLQHIQKAFPQVLYYAKNLLYIFAGLELVFFGLIWALQQGGEWQYLFFKVLKIGFILLIIQNAAYLLNIVLQSFVDIGSTVANAQHLSGIIFNPAHLWQYGYDIGLGLLKAATVANSMGLSVLLLILGFGILFTFALLGIQIVLVILGFYVIALIALLFMPLGIFEPTSKILGTSIQSVLKAGVRVMVLIMVIGVALIIWNKFGLERGLSEPYNINMPLGLLLSALIFLYLSVKLPKIAANIVGDIGTQFLVGTPTGMQTQLLQTAISGASGTGTSLFDLDSVQTASTITPVNFGQPSAILPTEGTISVSASSVVPATIVGRGGSGISINLAKRQLAREVGKASQTAKGDHRSSRQSISESQLEQIRKMMSKSKNVS